MEKKHTEHGINEQNLAIKETEERKRDLGTSGRGRSVGSTK